MVEAVALLDLGVAHLHAVGDERLQALRRRMPAAHLVLELAAVALIVAGRARASSRSKRPFSCSSGMVVMVVDQLVVGDLEPEALGLVPQQGVVDQLVERLAAEVAGRRAAAAPAEHLLVAALEQLPSRGRARGA